MTRGNQREIDRQRAANRHAHSDTTKKEGSALQRREADAKALADKIAMKKEREEAASRGEVVESKKGDGGAVKKKDGTKK
jgi:hypothetical protein